MTQPTAPLVRASASALLLTCVAACFEAPERVSAASAPESPHAASDRPVRFAGRVTLNGDLASVQEGSLFLIVRSPGSRMPALTRKYEIGDPAFQLAGGQRVLHFSLDERDDMGGAAAPMAAEMELEVRFDPDGFVDTSEGVVRTAVRVQPGDQELSLELPDAAAAGARAPKDS